MQALYEPQGKAREYAPLAVNLYRGCTHGCVYCYAPACLHVPPGEFRAAGVPRPGILDALEKDIRRLGARPGAGPVLLCFSCDPYQPAEEIYGDTRAALGILGSAGIPIRVLTKNPALALRLDLDRLMEYAVDFGVSCVFYSDSRRREFEPGASPIPERLAALRAAKAAGLSTWISLEPVILPGEALAVIRETAEYTDLYRIGPLNHRKLPAPADWPAFLGAALELLTDLGARYYIKDDLWRHAVPALKCRFKKSTERST
jgi:DNA repair photolyase